MPRPVAESWSEYLGPGALSSFALAAATAGLGAGLPVAYRLRQVLHQAQRDERVPGEAILVLGRHLDPLDRPSAMYRARLDHALHLFHEGWAKTIVLTGGLTGKARRTEAEAGHEYLVEQGAPAGAIEREDRSRNTLENLFNVRETARERGWQRMLLVSDALHMARALALARGLRLEVAGSPVPVERAIRPGTWAWWQRACREAALLHWYHVGMVYSRAIRSERLLRRVT